MVYPRAIKRWITAVLVFFAWGFVMHGTGLLVHEFGGHGLSAEIFGCGMGAYKLTFFGHGQVMRKAPCETWTWTGAIITDLSGLVVTTAIGAVAAWLLHRRRDWPPMWRLLTALVAFFFLLGQLGYATSGGFHDVWDPRRSSLWLGEHGLHVLAWLPTMILYGLSAAYCARAAVDAYREHFGTKTRLRTLGHLASTLGVAGALYFWAFQTEWRIRTDLAMRGVEAKAQEVAAANHGPPPFPIDKVLLLLALAGVVYAFARPVTATSAPRAYPRRLLAVVALSTVGCFLVMLVLVVSS